jgi:hypothetical protein
VLGALPLRKLRLRPGKREIDRPVRVALRLHGDSFAALDAHPAVRLWSAEDGHRSGRSAQARSAARRPGRS